MRDDKNGSKLKHKKPKSDDGNEKGAFKREKKYVGQLYMRDDKNGSIHECKKNTIRVNGLEMIKRVQRANFDFKIKTRHNKVERKGREKIS